MNISVASFVVGGLFMLLAFVCLFLTGAAKQAHKQLVEAQNDRLQLAEMNKNLAAELQRRQPLIITDEQVIKLAHMVNNVREQLSAGQEKKVWTN